jgi:hypothetical protein
MREHAVELKKRMSFSLRIIFRFCYRSIITSFGCAGGFLDVVVVIMFFGHFFEFFATFFFFTSKRDGRSDRVHAAIEGGHSTRDSKAKAAFDESFQIWANRSTH